MLFPRDAWWTALFQAAPARLDPAWVPGPEVAARTVPTALRSTAHLVRRPTGIDETF